MDNNVKIGMADYKIGTQNDVLITLGLGSCIGIIIYDEIRNIAGMAHIMLPSSNEIKNNSNKLKFADTCLDLMMQELAAHKVNRRSLKAKIAGGAQMFSVSLNNQSLNIGSRNAAAVKEKLKSLNIPIISEDILGNYGRTIKFSCNTNQLHIKSIGKGEHII